MRGLWEPAFLAAFAELARRKKPPMIELTPGQHYLAVRCHECDAQFAFLHEPESPFTSATFLLVCPICHEQYEYGSKDTVRVEGLRQSAPLS